MEELKIYIGKIFFFKFIAIPKRLLKFVLLHSVRKFTYPRLTKRYCFQTLYGIVGTIKQ